MAKPKGESPEDRAARLRERRISEIERDKAAQGTAGDLTADLRSVYGLRGLGLAFGSSGPAVGAPSARGSAIGKSFLDRMFSNGSPRGTSISQLTSTAK